MEYLSEVLKILDGALKANASMAANYAGLLADKLDADGENKQSKLIREKLIRASSAIASAQDGASNLNFKNLPIDHESRLHTVDLSYPQKQSEDIVLPNGIHKRIQEFINNIKYFDVLRAEGASLPNRLLIYGPPGTGKTQLTRWICSHLELPLLTVRCDTLVSSLLGQTSRNLRRVFEHAQQHPCVLFLDEFDALGSARGNERDIGELQRVVIALLQNIDALTEETILVASTNHDRLLDPAIWRRFSFTVPMPLPDDNTRLHLWQKFLAAFTPQNLDIDTLVSISSGLSGAAIETICQDVKRAAIINGDKKIEESKLFQRLGLTIALLDGKVISTIEGEIAWLRDWQPRKFSLRALAKLYDYSLRQVTNIVKGEIEDGTERKTRKKGQ